MFNQNGTNFRCICFSSTNITVNGKTFGAKKLYTNINGIENSYNAIDLPEDFENLLDEELYNKQKIYQRNTKALEYQNQRQSEIKRRNFLEKKLLIENTNDDEMIKREEESKKEYEKEVQYGKDIDLMSESNLNDTYMNDELDKIMKNNEKRENLFDNEYKANDYEYNLDMDDSDKEKIEKYNKKIKELEKYSNHPKYNEIMKKFKFI